MLKKRLLNTTRYYKMSRRWPWTRYCGTVKSAMFYVFYYAVKILVDAW